MFQFPGCPPMRLWIHLMVTEHYSRRVSPFGYPWIYACLRLPMAFRSLPRPSSAISAWASALCSSSLDLFFPLISSYAVEPLHTFLQGRSGLCSFRLPCAVFKVRWILWSSLHRILKTVHRVFRRTSGLSVPCPPDSPASVSLRVLRFPRSYANRPGIRLRLFPSFACSP